MQKTNRSDRVFFDISKIQHPSCSLLIGRNRLERVRLTSLLLQQSLRSSTHPLQAVVAISSTPHVLKNELAGLIPSNLPLHIIASNEAGSVMPTVVDFLVQYARMGFESDGVARTPLHVTVVIDCTESDLSRLLKKTVFCRDIVFNGHHFDASCIFLSGIVPHLSPDLRSNLQYVFAFAEPLVEQRKSMFKYFYGVFEQFSDFCDCFERYVQSGNDALVIDNTVRSNNRWHMLSACTVPTMDDLKHQCLSQFPNPLTLADPDFVLGLKTVIDKYINNDDDNSVDEYDQHHRSRNGKRRRHHTATSSSLSAEVPEHDRSNRIAPNESIGDDSSLASDTSNNTALSESEHAKVE